MLIEAGRLKFYISPAFAVFFALTANTVAGKTYIVMLIFSLIHESMHIALLFFCGIKGASLKFGAGGIAMEADGFNLLSYKKTVLCTIIPPVLNIAAGGICYFVFLHTENPLIYESAVINLVMGTGNLLPFSFLDGGRALEAFLSLHYHIEKAMKICDTVSFAVLIITGAVFFLTFITGKRYLFIVFFFFYCLSGYISEKTKSRIT